jgi:hypothetical protein
MASEDAQPVDVPMTDAQRLKRPLSVDDQSQTLLEHGTPSFTLPGDPAVSDAPAPPTPWLPAPSTPGHQLHAVLEKQAARINSDTQRLLADFFNNQLRSTLQATVTQAIDAKLDSAILRATQPLTQRVDSLQSTLHI